MTDNPGPDRSSTPHWFPRPGRLAATPVRPGVLVGALVAAVLVIALTIALVSGSGPSPSPTAATSGPRSAAPPANGGPAPASRTSPPTGTSPTTAPPSTGSGAPVAQTSPVAQAGPGGPNVAPAGAVPPQFNRAFVFSQPTLGNDAGAPLTLLGANDAEGCAVHLGPGLADAFQRRGCSGVEAATYVTGDRSVYVGALVFAFQDDGSANAEDAAASNDQTDFLPLLPRGVSAPTTPQVQMETSGRYLIVAESWYANGKAAAQGDPQLSAAPAPLFTTLSNELPQIPGSTGE